MISHTPGPWRVDETWNLITAEDGMIEVAALHSGERIAPKRNSKGTATANARLISAAPDLLEALQNIEANLTGEDCQPERIADSLRRAKAAIAKAEGKS